VKGGQVPSHCLQRGLGGELIKNQRVRGPLGRVPRKVSLAWRIIRVMLTAEGLCKGKGTLAPMEREGTLGSGFDELILTEKGYRGELEIEHKQQLKRQQGEVFRVRKTSALVQ